MQIAGKPERNSTGSSNNQYIRQSLVLWIVISFCCGLAVVGSIAVRLIDTISIPVSITTAISGPHATLAGAAYAHLPVKMRAVTTERKPYFYLVVAIYQIASVLGFLPFKLILIWCAFRVHCSASPKQRAFSFLQISFLAGTCFLIASLNSTQFFSSPLSASILKYNLIYWLRYAAYCFIWLVILIPLTQPKELRLQHGLIFNTRSLLLITVQIAIISGCFSRYPNIGIDSNWQFARNESLIVVQSLLPFLATTFLVWRMVAVKWSVVSILLSTTACFVLLEYISEIVFESLAYARIAKQYLQPGNNAGWYLGMYEFVAWYAVEYAKFVPVRIVVISMHQLLMVSAIKSFSASFFRGLHDTVERCNATPAA